MAPRSQTSWVLLVLSLPTQGATARMRIWRALKALGCGSLRDGAYLLPATAEHTNALTELAQECLREGGTAWVLSAVPLDAGDDSYQVLFDRADDYNAQVKAWKAAASSMASLGAAELNRQHKRFQRDYEALRAVDFFPGDASAEAEAAWLAFGNQVARLLSPDEPEGTAGQIPKLDRADYQGRLWATRRRLWVDRVASAWLIRRFIDRDARFQWLAKPSDCPRKALGFDFDGATFSHVGDRVTFETLLASFGLETDPVLMRLGALVHSLDVGGEPIPEAKGFEAVLAGARERLADDDALLNEIGTVLDSLYAHFEREAQRNNA